MIILILILIYLISAAICCWCGWANFHILKIWLEDDSKPRLMYFIPCMNTLNAIVWLYLFLEEFIKGDYKRQTWYPPKKPKKIPTLKEVRMKKLKKLNKNRFSFK